MRVSPLLPSGALLAGLLSSAVVEVVAWGGGKGDKCASEWGQCGGKDWTGPKCCPKNWECTKSNDYYSQCLAKPEHSGCKNSKYAQCGGKGYEGPTCCPTGWACAKENDYYSQCRQKLDGHGCTNGEWAQCGGQGYTGEKCCAKGTYCKKESDWWSYCAAEHTTTGKPTTSKHTTTGKTTTKPTTSKYTTTGKTTTKPTTSKYTTTGKTTSKPTTSKYTTTGKSTSKHTTTGKSTTTSKTCPTSTTTGYPTAPPSRPTVVNNQQELRLSPDWDINAPPQEREFFWDMSEMPGSPDGYERTMLVVNGQFPGPLLEVNNGDTVLVHVTNHLSDAMTIHWHGLHQNGSQWQDGPSGVTQCPIMPGVTYTYKFTINSPDQYGTYWWHAHRAAYYTDGLTGPLVIHSPNDPLKRGQDFDIDQYITLQDWYHPLSEVITAALQTPQGFNGTAIAPSPQAMLVNGRAIFNCSFAAPNETCTQLDQLDLPELHFPPNKRIRLRFAHVGFHPPFRVSVDEHVLQVVEADDTPVNPLPVHRIQIATAQRYSGIFDTTGNKVGDSFYLRSDVNTACLGLPTPDLNTETRIIIRIVDEEDCTSTARTLPNSTDWSDPTTGACTDLDASLLVPQIVRAAPSPPSQIHVFNSSFIIPNGVFRWTINTVTFESFAYDPILQRLARGEDIPPMRTAVITAGLEVLDIVVQNLQGADHPFHLHDYNFWVLSSGNGTITPEEAGQLQHNLTNPLRRDTITVAPGTWQVLRVVTDIPGVALFHCHIGWHQVQGLLAVLVSQPDRIRDFNIPADNLALCNGGNVSQVDPGRKRALPESPVPTRLTVKPRRRWNYWLDS